MSPSPLHTAGHALVFAVGVAAIALTLLSAVRTVILPRATRTRFMKTIDRVVGVVFRALSGRAPSYERRDAVFALFGPVQLLSLLVSWLVVEYFAFTLCFWALDAGTWRKALDLSGSSLLTLGFTPPRTGPQTTLTFVEAMIGLVLLALLITYLPSVYTAFSRREQAVARLAVRAGTPPSAAEMLWRAYSIGRADDVLQETFAGWERWFTDVQETHGSFPSLVYFRSPDPAFSWVTAAGAVLDAAAMRLSSVDHERMPEASLCIRSGRLALTAIADFHGVRLPAEIAYGDPVTVLRSEFDDAYDRIAESGAPMKPDRAQAFADFAGWRVNYDIALIALAALTYAPYAPWSSDRSVPDTRRLPRWRRVRPPSPARRSAR